MRRPEEVVIPANLGQQKGTWFVINEGIRGVAIETPRRAGRLHAHRAGVELLPQHDRAVADDAALRGSGDLIKPVSPRSASPGCAGLFDPAGREVLLPVDAERLEHRRVQVGDGLLVLRLLAAFGVGLADDQAAADAAAGEGDAEAVRPVVAAAERVELRRAAELADAEDDGVLERVALGAGRESAPRTPGRERPSVACKSRGCWRGCPSRRASPRRSARRPRSAAGPRGSRGRTACRRTPPRTAAGSCETSNAFSCSELIIRRARSMVSL